MYRYNKMATSALFLGVSLFPLACAYAQEAPPAPAEAAPSSSALEDIVVTAQKREAKLQDVPLSISAYSAKTLGSMKIDNTQDLSAITPGLQMSRQINTIQPFIRGIGQLNSAVGEESKTAIYVDGVYQSSLSAGVLALNNIERVEVLKGPQGTLFGRNAVAGVIQIITRDPSHTASTDLSVGYGRFDTLDFTFYGTRGITENLAADIAVYYNNQLDGWGKNLATGRDAFKSHEFSARTKWKLDIGDNTSAILAADINKSYIQQGVAVRKLQGPGVLVGGDTLYPGFYNLSTRLDPNFFPPGQEPGATKDQWGTSLTVNHDMDWASIVSITAYQKLDTVTSTDVGGQATPYVSLRIPTMSDTYSQELRLLSGPESPVKWIGGLYYYYNKGAYGEYRQSGRAFGGGGNFVSRISSQTARSLAAFAQVTVPITDSTNIEGGIRYTNDRRRVKGYLFTQATTGAPVENSATFGKVTYKASVDHKFTEDVMAYVSYSRGFKGGLFNTFAFFDPAAEPEVIDSYEAGLKTEWFDRRLRLNIGAFRSKITNQQVSQVLGTTARTTNAASSRTQGFEFEAVASPASGLTLSGSATYLDTEYLAYNNASITVPNPAGGNFAIIGNATGNKLFNAPKWSVSTRANYEVPTSIGTFTGNVLYAYNSGFYWNVDNRIFEPSYSQVNASLGWLDNDGVFGITVWGKNLTGARYHSFMLTSTTGDVGSPAPPLTFGVTFAVHLR